MGYVTGSKVGISEELAEELEILSDRNLWIACEGDPKKLSTTQAKSLRNRGLLRKNRSLRRNLTEKGKAFFGVD